MAAPEELVPAGQEQEAQERVGQQPEEQERAGQERAGQEPAGQEPAGQEPAGQEPVEQERGGTEPEAWLVRRAGTRAQVTEGAVRSAAAHPEAEWAARNVLPCRGRSLPPR